jgi:hypothetical protein
VTSFGYSDESFEVSSSTDSVVVDPNYEGANTSRAAALSTWLQVSDDSLRRLAPELTELGFSQRLIQGQQEQGQGDPFRELGQLFLDEEPDGARVRLWSSLNDAARPRDVIAFLIAILRSPLERESAAAAAALWRQLEPMDLMALGSRLWHFDKRLFDLWAQGFYDSGWPGGAPWQWPLAQPDDEIADGQQDFVPWDPEPWEEIFRRLSGRFRGDPYADQYLVAILIRRRLDLALRSTDPVTRSLALAAFQPNRASGDLPPNGAPNPPEGASVVSTMIHGTGAFTGDWWRPQGDFHSFILRNHRPNLFSLGGTFSWSGSLRDRHREKAAAYFIGWACDRAPHGLQTVFGHSYGGEVAARAVLGGAKIQELVLLSTPTTPHVVAATRGSARVVDVRLRFDLVLGIAGRGQRLPASANATEVRLSRWWWDHGATHQEHVWRVEDIAAKANL